MSKHRTIPAEKKLSLEQMPVGAHGRRLCRQCSQEVPKGRLTFCGKACIAAWRIKSDTGFMRAEVFKRDKGVCAGCGIDTKRTAAELGLLLSITRSYRLPESDRVAAAGEYHKRIYALKLGNRRSLWDADHIKEVNEGGGECGLDNIQTLCLACHRAKTAQYNSKRSKRAT